MQPSLKRTLVAGAVATAALIGFTALAPRIGLYGLSEPAMLGGLITLDTSRALWLGWAGHVLMGAVVFPFFYVSLLVVWFPGPGALLGWIWGVLLWTLLVWPGMVLLAEFHPLVLAGRMQDPGVLLLNLGPTAPITSLLGHSIYGLLLGGVCGKGSR